MPFFWHPHDKQLLRKTNFGDTFGLFSIIGNKETAIYSVKINYFESQIYPEMVNFANKNGMVNNIYRISRFLKHLSVQGGAFEYELQGTLKRNTTLTS